MSKKSGPNVWVVRSGSGFAVKREGNPSPVTPTATQQRAIEIARPMARQYGSELIIQGRDGRIRDRDSHGSDPFPPKG